MNEGALGGRSLLVALNGALEFTVNINTQFFELFARHGFKDDCHFEILILLFAM